MTPAIAVAPPHQAAPATASPDNEGAVTSARSRHAKPGRDSAGIWLYVAAAGLFALAGAAAAVSFSAQYRLVYAARRLAVAAGLEAAIPDAAALVFACLGVALALHGRRAIRARLLNMAAAGTSVTMNVIAAAPGWRDLAVWAMPPAAYALSSDTLIGVVRTSAIARHSDSGRPVEEITVLAVAVGLMLWLLRLSMAPGVNPGRVPRLGPRGVPGRPRPPRRPPRTSRLDRPGRPGRVAGRGRPDRSPTSGRRFAGPGDAARAAGRRRPGSWRWSPIGTGRWRPSRWGRSRRSPPPSRPRPT